ncbi:hypothetical protein [Arthrobacter sp. 92]|uniref:hypothetical protein n=1 Tax=Arthrobacter sp. 92 TaxID=3418175 RepID=UPI003D027E43
MTSKLDVTVAVDIDSRTVTVTPTGHLTLHNVQALTPVAQRAASLAPDLTLVLDLRTLSGMEPAAAQLLKSSEPAGARILRPAGAHPAENRPANAHLRRSHRRTARMQGATV